MSYDDIEEKVWNLIWNNEPKELDFMIGFMLEVHKLPILKFNDTQAKIFQSLIAKYDEKNNQAEDELKALIVADCRKNESNNNFTYYSKFLYSMYELIFEYSVLDSDYVEKQSDIIENFICAYENLSIDPVLLGKVLEKFESNSENM